MFVYFPPFLFSKKNCSLMTKKYFQIRSSKYGNHYLMVQLRRKRVLVLLSGLCCPKNFTEESIISHCYKPKSKIYNFQNEIVYPAFTYVGWGVFSAKIFTKSYKDYKEIFRDFQRIHTNCSGFVQHRVFRKLKKNTQYFQEMFRRSTRYLQEIFWSSRL